MAVFASSPETFLVEEIPAYEPVGAGPHTFLWIEKQGLNTVEEILQGAGHILAELIAETADVRAVVRQVLWDTGKLQTSKSEKLAEGQGLEYKDYFQFTETLRHIPPHRVLAINRGEKDNALSVKLDWDEATGRRVALERLPLPKKERTSTSGAVLPKR